MQKPVIFRHLICPELAKRGTLEDVRCTVAVLEKIYTSNSEIYTDPLASLAAHLEEAMRWAQPKFGRTPCFDVDAGEMLVYLLQSDSSTVPVLRVMCDKFDLLATVQHPIDWAKTVASPEG